MSHNTDAQDAPVASQEAEAREEVLTGRASRSDRSFNRVLDAYAAVIRALDRERYAALVEGVRALHNGHGGAYGGTICHSACHALAALEEAGSA